MRKIPKIDFWTMYVPMCTCVRMHTTHTPAHIHIYHLPTESPRQLEE